MVDKLTAPQLRILGSLVEKQATVPDTYPMTLKGLQSACNQKNNREPVTDYDTFILQTTLDELKALGLVRFVYASHGARTTKYRHVLDEKLRLELDELALLAVLFLRGPQTLNELRSRTERSHRFEDNEQVAQALERLASREDPLVLYLGQQPGQREARWGHLLGDDEPPPGKASDVAPMTVSAPLAPTVGDPLAALEARIAELESRIAALEAVITDPSEPSASEE